MDEKEILNGLEKVSQNLDLVEKAIEKNNWDEVGLLLSQVNIIQAKINSSTPPLDILLAKNLSFEKQYTPLKESLITKTTRVISSIEEWKTKQLEKISESRNVLDNLSKYYRPSTISHYIDTNE